MSFLKISEEVSGLTEVSDEFVPGDGELYYIGNFEADCQKQDSIVKVIWDYEGAGEQVKRIRDLGSVY